MRQAEGGDYAMDPALTAYVQRVGNRLAAVSDRKLPYEFVVLNNTIPNAWALPGGKIAVNRGLLLQLKSEAELAAVLGHEIVHAAARHSAQQMSRGMLAQGGLLAAQVAASDSDYGGLYTAGAGLAAQLALRHAEGKAPPSPDDSTALTSPEAMRGMASGSGGGRSPGCGPAPTGARRCPTRPACRSTPRAVRRPRRREPAR